MKTFQEYMNSELVKRWESHSDNLLEGLNEPNKEACAIFLQAQLEGNEPSLANDGLKNFRRISIPLARRVFSEIQIETSSKSLGKWMKVAGWPYNNLPVFEDHNIATEVRIVKELANEIAKSIKENNITKIHNFALNGDHIEVNCE